MSERLSRIVNHPSFKPICFSIAGATVGLGVGLILGRRHPIKVHVIPEQEPLDYEELEVFISNEEKKAGISNDEEIVVPAPISDRSSGRTVTGAEMVAQTLKREMTKSHTQEPDVVAEVPEFAATDEEWNYDKEVASRNSNQPYVIHYDEFFAKEMEDVGYLQMQLTYYAGDDIMTDQEESPIYNYASIIGELKFGHGSKGDPSTFYVRNDKRKAEYEITRVDGHFAEEVMGLQLENGGERAKRLAHSKVDKFRSDD